MSTLRQWTIYDHPLDAPDHVVVREWLIGAGRCDPASAYKCESLERAREYVLAIDPNLVCLQRHPKDDPVIVETWL